MVSGFWVQGSGFRVQGSSLVSGAACLVSGVRCQVSGSGGAEHRYLDTETYNSIHKPPALPVRIEKVLPLPGGSRIIDLNLNDAGGL